MILGNHADKPPVLTCWKDIAKYMGKGVRTVQRWEQDFGLPVRRPLGSNKKAVLARPQDLDAWVALRCGSRQQAAALQFLPDGYPKQDGSAAMLSSLAAQLERSRRLQNSNRELMTELKSMLNNLCREIISIHNPQ